MLICCLLIWVGCSQDEQQKTNTEAAKEDKQPTFQLKFANSGQLDIEHLGDRQWSFGKIQGLKLLVFFRIDCESCRAIVPHLVDIQEQYKNHLEVIGVMLDDGVKQEELENFLQLYNINFEVANSAQNLILKNYIDKDADIPFLVLFDMKNEYVQHYIGAIPQEMLEFDIRKVLQQNGELGEPENIKETSDEELLEEENLESDTAKES